MSSPIQPPIVFFDGVCGLCNHWVDFLIVRDRNRTLRFAPLQGETASRLIPEQANQTPDSVIFWDETGTYQRSDAIWRMLILIPGIWRIVALALRFVPPFLRNAGYRVVAKYRYTLFGKKETCRLPTAQERDRILP